MSKSNTEKKALGISQELPLLAASLNLIYKTVQEEGLTEKTKEDLTDQLNAVMSRFQISQNAAVLLAHIAERSITGGSTRNELARYLGCSNLEYIGFRQAEEELKYKRIVVCSKWSLKNTLNLSFEAHKALEEDVEFVPFPMTGLSADELFTRFRLFFSDFGKDIIDCFQLLDNIHMVLEGNPDLDYCKKVCDSPLMTECSATEQRFFFYLCHRYVSYGNDSVPIDLLLHFTEPIEDDQLIRRSLSNECSTLQKAGFVTFGYEDGFQDTSSLSLTEKVTRLFFNEVTLEHRQAIQHKELVPCSSITPKELYYNPMETEQMERLASLLTPENFNSVQQRLRESGMRQGFAVLFSGGAGCGKTAGAYELARRTGRDVFAVDMSQLKSKWVGDSEKIVKGLFTTYKGLCNSCENAPILLFNEADAIFSKRISEPDSSVDQMLNSIQNICLEAIENLDGILIATTNLPGNFCDEAFLRRFIIKIDFGTPGAETRAKIWKSIVPGISDEDACALGEGFVFSGGNIENIARKAAVSFILSGQKVGLDQLRKYCNEEAFAGTNRTRIGF